MTIARAVSVADSSEYENETQNHPFLSVSSRRLRTLKKAKIEKYEEELNGETKGKLLNEDQRLAVQKKGEVVLLIKELEELTRQMEDVYKEEQKKLKKQRKQEQNEAEKAKEEAVSKAKERFSEGVKNLVELIFACKHAVFEVPSSLVSKAQKENVLRVFQTINGPPDAPIEQDAINAASEAALAYIQGTSEDCKLQKKSVEALLSYMLSPPPPEPPVNYAQQSTNVEEMPLLTSNSAEPLPTLSFMTPSSVLDDPAIISTGSSFYHHEKLVESSNIQGAVAEMEKLVVDNNSNGTKEHGRITQQQKRKNFQPRSSQFSSQRGRRIGATKFATGPRE